MAWGKINEAGLDFYDRLVDALLARHIQPWATLFHWDMPVALFHRGGWLNRASADWFAEYAGVVAERLGDRVKHWMTINEPQVYIGLGHAAGTHAPGMPYDRPDVLRAAHHSLLAHGHAVRAIRAATSEDTRVGWAPHGSIPYPATSREEGHRRRPARVHRDPGSRWVVLQQHVVPPIAVIRGEYPADGVRKFGQDMPAGFERDMDAMSPALDFFGVNIYQGQPIVAGEDGGPREASRPVGYPITMCHWPVVPEALYWGPRFLHERYGLPLYITESGCASMDWVHQDGRVHDAPRIDYLARHLTSLRAAVRDGVDVRGYFVWSILDNFEWGEGYRMRFGLIYVDFATLERIPKDSYMWYQQVIMSNGGGLPEQAAALR